jgi:hypothetical protein
MTKIKRSWTQEDMDEILKLVGDNKPRSKGFKNAITIAANHFGVTYNALYKKYIKYLNGQRFYKGKVRTVIAPEIKPEVKKISRFWSVKDLDVMRKIIENKTSRVMGIRAAANYFNVTPNAINCRYKRYLDGLNMTRTNRDTQKIPILSNSRKPYKKRIPSESVIPAPVVKSEIKNEIAFTIKDFKIDLKTKKLIITL